MLTNNISLDEPDLGEKLAGLAGRYPHAPALLDNHGLLMTYSTLSGYAGYIQKLLTGHGVQQHSAVALMMEQGLMMSATCLSMMTSCICVPINPALHENEIKRLLLRHGITCMVTSQALVSVTRKIDLPELQTITIADAVLKTETFDNYDLTYNSDPGQTALILHTSGSTDSGKAVALTQRQLIHSACNVIQSLRLTEQDRCLNVMPPFHIGAIVDLTLAPLLSGGSVAVAEDARAETFYDYLADCKPSWYQAVPTMLSAIVTETPEPFAGESQPLRFIRSVSSKLPEELAKQVEQLFKVPVIEIYGMTEAAGLISSNPLEKPRRNSVGIPAGPELRIVDAHGNATAPMEEGEILIRGDTVIKAYLEDASINEKNFSGDWLITGDRGYQDEQGYLFITGRSKEQINRGGEKISPLEIDMLLNGMPGVVEAASFAVPHDTLGEDIAIAVVRQPGSMPGKQQIRDYLKDRIADFKVPNTIYFTDSLPRAPGGKLRRYQLLSHVQATATDTMPDHGQLIPADRLARKIAKAWQACLNLPQIRPDDNFFELGGDSLKAATLMNTLQAETGLTLPTALLFDKPDFFQFYTHIKALDSHAGEAGAAASSGKLPKRLEHAILHQMRLWPGKRLGDSAFMNGFNTAGSLPPLFWCCQVYEEIFPLVDGLGVDQPVYVMSSLNEFVKNKKKRDYPQLAAIYTEEILELQPEGPFYIGGFCGGAKVAHEIALGLTEAGHEVAVLCIQENYINKPYAGRVAMFCGGTGIYSPYGLFTYPEQGIGKLYTGDVSIHRYNCGHTDFYQGGGSAEVSRAFIKDLQTELHFARNRLVSPARVSFQTADDCTQRYLAREIQIGGPRIMPVREQLPVPVILKNTGTEIWQPTAVDGITVSARWVNIHNNVKMALAGYARIDAVLKPGDARNIVLDIESTRTSGLRRLQVDLLQEGVGWLTQYNEPQYSKWIWVK